MTFYASFWGTSLVAGQDLPIADPTRTNVALSLLGLILLVLGLFSVFIPDQPSKSRMVESTTPTIVTESPQPGESPQPKTTTTESGEKTTVTTPSSASRRTDTTIAWLLGAGAVLILVGQFYGRIQSITLGPASLSLSGVTDTAKGLQETLQAFETALAALKETDKGLVGLQQVEHKRITDLEQKVDAMKLTGSGAEDG